MHLVFLFLSDWNQLLLIDDKLPGMSWVLSLLVSG